MADMGDHDCDELMLASKTESSRGLMREFDGIVFCSTNHVWAGVIMW